MSREEIIEQKKSKFLNIGREKAISKNTLSSDDLFSGNKNKILHVKNKILNKKVIIISFVITILFLFLSLLYFS